jgi:Tol biopolymer transport system component
LLYYSSNRSGGGGGHDIYVSPMIGEDRETFGTPSPVAELNTASDDYHPFVRRKDGLEVIFFSNRAGGSGYWDLWSSNRRDTLSSWSAPVNLGPLVNSGADEARPSISWDGTTLYFWTYREGTIDVYMATRTKLKGKDRD